jgi:hypothetical protein
VCSFVQRAPSSRPSRGSRNKKVKQENAAKTPNVKSEPGVKAEAKQYPATLFACVLETTEDQKDFASNKGFIAYYEVCVCVYVFSASLRHLAPLSLTSFVLLFGDLAASLSFCLLHIGKTLLAV